MKKITVPPVIADPKHKPEYDFDNLTDIKGLDPLAPKHIEFDWELLRRSLGEAKEELTGPDFALLAQSLREIMRWVVKGDRLETIGRRAVAIAWVVNPEIFKGSSVAKLAKVMRSTPDVLHKLTADASRSFGHRNHAQGHAWNFRKS